MDQNSTLTENISSDDINDLLKELQNTKNLPLAKQTIQQANPNVSDDSINDFIMSRASALIDKSMGTLDEIKQNVESAGDPEEVDAYAKLITAIASSIEALNKINIQNKKDKSAKDIKKMDIEAKKELAANQPKNLPTHNTNVLIAPREEVMKRLMETLEANNPAQEIPVDTLDE